MLECVDYPAFRTEFLNSRKFSACRSSRSPVPSAQFVAASEGLLYSGSKSRDPAERVVGSAPAAKSFPGEPFTRRRRQTEASICARIARFAGGRERGQTAGRRGWGGG